MDWNNKRVLITGGAGFLGFNLAKSLLKKRAYVIVLDNFSTGKKENVSPDCEMIIGDVQNNNILDNIHNVDYVFHFAAPSSIMLFKNNPQESVDVTINGFKNVLSWSIKNDVAKVIYPSSGSVYGLSSIPQSEDDMPKPVNMYGKTKLVCEAMAQVYSEWIPTVGLRIFAGFGLGEEHKSYFASVITLFLRSMLKNESPQIYGNGMQKRDFIYITDVVNALIQSVEKNIKNEIINVGSGTSYSFNQIVNIINNLLGKKIKPKYISKPADYLKNTLADTEKMNKLLDVQPLDLNKGLEKYICTLENLDD
jgi:nucleoside-diphosphate-sugar epimerase